MCGVEGAEEGGAAAGLDPPPEGDQRVQAGQLGHHLQGNLGSGHLRLYPGPTCRSSSSLRPNLPPEQRDTASLATRSLRVVAGPARAGEVDDCKYRRLAQLTSLGEEDAGQHIHPLVRVLLVRHQRPLALLQEVEDEELRVLRGLHADLRHGAQQVAEGGLGGGYKVNTDGGNPAAASPRPA